MNKTSLMQRLFLAITTILCIHPVTAAEQTVQPNVIIVMTDEHNFRTLGAYRQGLVEQQAKMWGDTVVETPNIDWLADNGAIATSFYAAAPVCTPSRGAFVTGMYPQNNHAVQNNEPLRGDAITFAQVLKESGYATGYIGKWHLDGSGKPQWAPERQFGFDDNRYMFNRGHWKIFEDTVDGPKVADGGASAADETSFSTDYLFNKMFDFIELNKAKPFAMMLSLGDPHGPDSVRTPYDTMYESVEFSLPHTMNVDPADAPIWGQPASKSNSMQGYYGMIKLIDDKMAQLYSKLEQLQLLDNTIIVFTSDHGDLKGEHARQNKGVPFEGSARIPFLVYYPEKIPAKTVVTQALTTVDFQQTLLGLAGIAASGNEDGRDASPLLMDPENCQEWQDLAFMRQSSKTGEGWITAISDRYKLVFNPEGEPWLFDLENDPDELINYYTDIKYRAVVHFMATALKAYALEHNDVFYNHEHMQAEVEKAIASD
ncbi:sulfatase [Thalassotalea fonticola]|uniref:Sulfatase n=1 Tax=Thalassotalea fonticola TaxID=3065649 RepID=A0ABZ0GLN1_9GAMM|nr:sulfatase [Colwelliaceae bacterium S1-1]